MIKSFITVIKSVKKSYLTFFEPIPAHDPPVWTDSDDIKDGLVYAPHWYDLKSVFSKVIFNCPT